jgi:hypothetical protein
MQDILALLLLLLLLLLLFKNSVALSPQANYTDCVRHLSTKFSANLCGQRGVAWSARRIPNGR